MSNLSRISSHNLGSSSNFEEEDRTELFLAKVNAHITSQILHHHSSLHSPSDNSNDDLNSSFILHKNLNLSNAFITSK